MPTCTQCRAEIVFARVCPSCHALQPLVLGSSIAPGVTIDRGDSKIVVEGKIGEGGMGVVFRAWRFFAPTDPRAASGPRLLALKVLRAHRAADPRLREYFRREAEALHALSHPNIVQFDELFEHDGSSALAMEFVDGEPLSNVVQRHRERAHSSRAGPSSSVPMSIPCMPALRAVAYFEQLLGALAALHALEIVHRDVKPQNVIVRRDGIVKLTDFGIAKHDIGASAHAPTDAGVAPGTGVYMSPEQVVGAKLDGRSDLYSAAIVLFEMLAGRPPFSPIGKSELAIRQEQLTVEPPTVRSFFPHLAPPIDSFFTRALAKDPSVRFADAIAMGDAVHAAFGMTESDEWRALAEMVRRAREPASPNTDRMSTLRDIVVARYRTEPVDVSGRV